MLRKLQELKKKEEGFTIIEVLIVLAIAALILVIVLVAIPQLQRNQRNSGRQAEASRILTSVQNYVAATNGTAFPTAGAAATAALNSVDEDVGNLGQYTLTAGTTFVVSTPATVGTGTITDVANVRVVPGAICNTGSVGQVTTTGAAARSISVQFAVESGGAAQARCVSS